MYVIHLSSGEAANVGNLVLRCRLPREEQCKFFLWEKDEAAAREQNASHPLPVPQTPTRRQNSHPVSLPTPNSRASGDRTSRPAFLQSLDMSPTPRRFNEVGFKSDEDEDLSVAVLELLRSDNLKLKTSTEVQLRHTINSAVGVYETRLRKSEGTISELRRKLDDLERDRTDAKADP